MYYNATQLKRQLTFVQMFVCNFIMFILGFPSFCPIGGNAKLRGGQARFLQIGSGSLSEGPLGSKKDEQIFLAQFEVLQIFQ